MASVIDAPCETERAPAGTAPQFLAADRLDGNVVPGGGGNFGGAAQPLPSGWACGRHGTGRHSVYGSYRGATEGPDGNGLIEKLVDAIEKGGDAGAGAVTVFYDVRCNNKSKPWREEQKNGLEGALLFMPLVSVGALKIMVERAAGTQPDTMLKEWEIALERQRRGLCLVLPIFIQDVGADGKLWSVDLTASSYPETPHVLSGISIRSTLVALFELYGAKLTLDRSGAPDPAQLAKAVGDVRGLLDSQDARALRHRLHQEYQLTQVWRPSFAP